jgi:hypothetical protein
MKSVGYTFSFLFHFSLAERILLISFYSFSYLIGGLHPAIVIVLELITYFTEDKVPNVALFYTLIIVIGCILGSLAASVFFNKFYFKHMKTWRN